ncbi:MAG: M23 family metallopeptidase, partial [Desulfarculus sp.]|nr:M23 family metallopeptidase [Desulfarculus sp.]
RLLGREAPLAKSADGCWRGLVAADLEAPAGSATLAVVSQGRVLASREVKVKAHDYGLRRITVEGKYVEPDPEQLARHWDEAARMKAVYALATPRQLWSGPWRTPLDSVVVGPFGRRSLVNDQPRSPHGGVDLRAAVGVPVLAPAAGRAALVLDTFFGGLTLMIDHGLGLISAYRHLSQVSVGEGQMVRAGQVIALSGMSGRITGPHLHFDLHWAGARVDPLAWIALSRQPPPGQPAAQSAPARPTRGKEDK